jgi:hypothetical protein
LDVTPTPKNFCWRPYTSLYIDKFGYQSPCCGYSDKESFNLLENDYHKNIRDHIKDKKLPTGCILKCTSLEDVGVKWTDRTNYAGPKDISLVKNNQFKLKQLELVIDNVCNLSCITCGSIHSSKWIAENTRMGVEDPMDVMYMNTEFLKDVNFWKDIEVLIIWGGEPFYSKRSLDLINWVLENDLAKNIELNIYSNGTILPKNAHDIAARFRKLRYSFSIDGTFERFETLRWPAKWNDVVENLNRAKELPNTEVLITYTYSMLNACNAYEDIAYLTENFTQNLAPNMLVYPSYYAARHLPDGIKKKLIEQYKDNKITQTFIPELKAERSEVKYREAIALLEKLDSFRNTNYKVLFNDF